MKYNKSGVSLTPVLLSSEKKMPLPPPPPFYICADYNFAPCEFDLIRIFFLNFCTREKEGNPILPFPQKNTVIKITMTTMKPSILFSDGAFFS